MTHPSASYPENVPPVLETSRLRLRPWRETDAPGPGEGPDSDSLRFMPTGAEPGPDDFPAWLARRRQDMAAATDLHWCIADSAADPRTADAAPYDAMLGNVQIFRMEPVSDVPDVTDVSARFQGELGYWLRPGARGRGSSGRRSPRSSPTPLRRSRMVGSASSGSTRERTVTTTHHSQSCDLPGSLSGEPTTRPGGAAMGRSRTGCTSSCWLPRCSPAPVAGSLPWSRSRW